MTAFYEPAGEGRVRATPLTRGPWGSSQHGGPVAALLAGAVERTLGRDDAMVARFSVELLRPVPVAELRIDVDVPRPGKRVAWAVARLEAPNADGGPTEVARAHAWVLRIADAQAPATEAPPPAPPEEGTETPFYPVEGENFADGVEARFLHGGWTELGRALAWFRLRVPVVAGEAPSAVQRVLVAADCGNGISAEVDFATHVYINPELTVALHRLPRGEWVALDAQTSIGPGGVGLARSVLADRDGVVGAGSQSLLVDQRPPAG